MIDTTAERQRFEAWMRNDYFGGLGDAGPWDDQRGCYTSFDSHMAFCGWRARAALPAAQALPPSYSGSVLTSGPFTETCVAFHFKDAAEAERWHDAITDAQATGDNLATVERALADRLAEALNRLQWSYGLLLARKPVRDAAETAAEAEQALAAHREARKEMP